MYKVSKEIQYDRLEIHWLNTARLRKLCILVFGYDPECENFDQTPYHENEVGAQNCVTLAAAGASEVPIAENPNVTHSRFTVNATCFSDKERIMRDDLPYVEPMYKYDGDVVKERLQRYIRSCGYPKWLSVTTSPSGSYREHHILDFLETHLPVKSACRRWSLMFADDYGPHKGDNAFNLSWERNYVMNPHGGGVTPVSQVPDTDLNQHLRHDYKEEESAILIKKLRLGDKVPKMSPEESIDCFVRVCSQKQLHLNAADGYKKTAHTVALDGIEDYLITREAKKA